MAARTWPKVQSASAMVALGAGMLLSSGLPAPAQAGGAVSSGDSVCRQVSSHLPPDGARLNGNGPMLDILVQVPGSALRLAAGAGPFVLSSSYHGTAVCQTNRLLQATARGTVEIGMPERFRGGEGALCHGDTVRLATMRGTPILVEENAGPGGAELDMTARAGDSWTPACHLSLATTPHYAVEEQFCRGADCRALRQLAPTLAETEELPPSVRRPDLLPDEKAAALRAMDGQDLPTLGQKAGTSRVHSFWDNLYAVVPITVNGSSFVAKLGIAGFGEHYGSATLLAIYRAVDGHVEAVAGFYLDVASRTLSGAKVTASPE